MRTNTKLAAASLLLALGAPLAAAWNGVGDEAFEELLAEYQEARAAHSKEMRKLYKEGDTAGLEALAAEEPALVFLEHFQAGADEHAGTDGAVPYLGWIVSDGTPRGAEDKSASLTALEILGRDHAASTAIGDALSGAQRAYYTLGVEPCIAFFDQVVERGATDALKAQALYGRASIRLRDQPTDEQRAAAIEDMRKVVALDPESSIAPRAHGAIFEAERLQIGMVAPDIEGEDLDGVAFKLSDYRGKVVVIDFWGDW